MDFARAPRQEAAMRLLVILALLLALTGVAAALTRPGAAEFDAMLDRAIRERLAATDIDASREALPNVALAACKLRPTDCVGLVRAGLDVTFEQRAFHTVARVEGFGRSATCRGAFGRFVCDRAIGAP
jgi:hypothetical protein